MNERELAARLDAAKLAVDDAGAAVTEAYAAEDAKLAARRRQEVDAAAAEVLDLQHRFDAARLRVERAQAEADDFAARLTTAAHETVHAHRAYRDLRTQIDELVAAVPGATSRADGPEPSHPWELQLRHLERAIRDTPEVPAPLPRWTGLDHRHEQDHANRLERDNRSGETAAAPLATSGQWGTLK